MSLNRKKIRTRLQEALGVEELDDKVDLLIYLNYVLFMERLAQEAEMAKKQVNKPNKTIILRNDDVDKHVESVLNQFRG